MLSQLTRCIGVFFFFPETSGRHLEEVDMIFTQSKNVFDTVSVAKKLPRGRTPRQTAGEVSKDDTGTVGQEIDPGLDATTAHVESKN